MTGAIIFYAAYALAFAAVMLYLNSDLLPPKWFHW